MSAANGTAVSEAASETRGPGRPRLSMLEGSHGALIQYCAPEVKTRRGLADVGYRQAGLGILEDGVSRGAIEPGDVSWFYDRAAMEAGAPRAWRPGALTELGRIAREFDDDTVIAVACALSEARPATTRDGARRLRAWRLRVLAEQVAT